MKYAPDIANWRFGADRQHFLHILSNAAPPAPAWSEDHKRGTIADGARRANNPTMKEHELE
jgi:hypothetical protein